MSKLEMYFSVYSIFRFSVCQADSILMHGGETPVCVFYFKMDTQRKLGCSSGCTINNAFNTGTTLIHATSAIKKRVLYDDIYKGPKVKVMLINHINTHLNNPQTAD